MVKTIKHLLKLMLPFWGEILLSILLGVATIGAGIGLMGTSAYLIASAALHPSIAELQVAIVGVRFFGLSRAVFRYLERMVSHSVNLHILSDLRVWFYKRIESATPKEVYTHKNGELLDHVMGDLGALENFYVRVFSPVIVAIVITVGLSLFIGQYSANLGLILLGGLFINGFVLPVISILITKKDGKIISQSRAALSADLIESLRGMEDIQSYSAQDQWVAKLVQSRNSLSNIQIKNSILGGVNSGLALGIMNLTILGILFYTILLVNRSVISGIDMAVILLMVTAGFESTMNLPVAAQNLNLSLESGKRLFSISGSQEIKTDLSIYETDRFPIKITFTNVGFKYPDEPSFQLNGISLSLEYGKKYALTGASGIGKTSLINLLLGFWKPDDGQIWFDSREAASLSVEERRSFFGVLSQNPFLFNETLGNNLLLAKPSARVDELANVIDQVGLKQWLMNLPYGFRTQMGELGKNVSGGELQRIAIARLLLQNRPYIILDEPFVHLDPVTAEQIHGLIINLFSHQGMLLITHDLSHLKNMDQIFVIEQGGLSEVGDYSTLIKSNGWFAKTVEVQAKLIKKRKPTMMEAAISVGFLRRIRRNNNLEY